MSNANDSERETSHEREQSAPDGWPSRNEKVESVVSGGLAGLPGGAIDPDHETGGADESGDASFESGAERSDRLTE